MRSSYFLRFFSFLLLLIVATSYSSAATLHAIIVADTNDWSIGESVKTDRQKIKRLTKSISRYTRLALKTYDIYGNQVGHHKVKTTLNRLSVGRNDVIFFYYSGHGGNSDVGSGWPFMDLKGGRFELKEVHRTLKFKNPRFFLVIGDTCNNFKGNFSITESRGGQGGDGSRAENYRQLFLNYRGYIMASSSEPGESSWGNSQDGGFFTYGFLKSLNQELASYSSPNWYTIMKRAEAPIELPNNKGVQNPQTVVKITPAKPGVAMPSVDSCYYFYKPGGVLCCRSRSSTRCDQPSETPRNECPYTFMKPGGLLCCRRPSGVTCEP